MTSITCKSVNQQQHITEVGGRYGVALEEAVKAHHW
jgi:hypothetical protein